MSSQIGVEPGTADKKVLFCFSDHQRSLSCRTLTIQVQQHVGLEQVFGPSHLALRHTRAKRHPDGGAAALVSPRDPLTQADVQISRCVYSPFHLSEMHHVVDGARLTHHVEPPQTCVGVAGVEGLEAVAQVSLTGHLGQLTGQILESERTHPNRDSYRTEVQIV